MATTLMHEQARHHGMLRKDTNGRSCPCCATGWHRPAVRKAVKQAARRREAREWRREAAAAD